MQLRNKPSYKTKTQKLEVLFRSSRSQVNKAKIVKEEKTIVSNKQSMVCISDILPPKSRNKMNQKVLLKSIAYRPGTFLNILAREGINNTDVNTSIVSVNKTQGSLDDNCNFK